MAEIWLLNDGSPLQVGGDGASTPDKPPMFATRPKYAIARRTAGNVSVSTTLVAVGADVAVAAVAGDLIEVGVIGHWTDGTANTSWMDIATWVSGAAVNWLSSGTGTGAAEGLPGLMVVANKYQAISSVVPYVVQAGDLSGGSVTLRVQAKTNTSGTRIMLANGSNPFIAWVVNRGQTP